MLEYDLIIQDTKLRYSQSTLFMSENPYINKSTFVGYTIKMLDREKTMNILGPEKQSLPEALPGSDPRVWARGHVAVVPQVKFLAPHFNLVFFGGSHTKERNVSGNVGGQALR